MCSQHTHEAALAHARRLTNDHSEAALLPLVDAYETGYHARDARPAPPRSPFLTPRTAEAWRAATRSPAPIEPPAPGLSRQMLRLGMCVVLLVVVVVTMAALFFLFGEDRTREVARPVNTDAQLANAFRLP